VQFPAPSFEIVKRQRDQFRAATYSRNTIASYGRDLRVFQAWCEAAQLTSLPAAADTIELYIADLIGHGRKVSTLQRHVSAIRHAHSFAGLPNPCNQAVRAVLIGAKRMLGQKPKQKRALTLIELRKMIEHTGNATAIQARNSALLLFGFATALRRSTLAQLTLDDLSISEVSITTHIRHEKQDRLGSGRTVTIPLGKDASLCPITAVKAWIKWRGNSPGPLFQGIGNGKPTGRAILGNRIGQIVQHAAHAIGLDSKSYGGHSLRSGFVTEAILAGVNDIHIMDHTGHASLEMLRTYFRPIYALRTNPCRQLGL